MNIWVIGRNYPSKENKMAGSFELEQANLLAKHGNQVSYIAAVFHPVRKIKKWGYYNFQDGAVNVFTYSVPYVPERFYLHIKRFQKKVWEILLEKVKKAQGIPDIIHVHYPTMITIPEAVLAYKEVGTHIILTEHWTKTLIEEIDNFQRRQLTQYVNEADMTISVGEPLKRAILNITGTKKPISIVPNMVPSLFSYQASDSKSCIYNFIAVGRLVPVKQIDQIALAFAQCFAGKKDIHLTIVGDGIERKRIEDIIKEYNMTSQVTLTGTLSRKETAERISLADSLICFSRLETFGVPIIEAWACGIPAIGVNGLGMTNCWKEELGYVVDFDNIEELKQAMQKIYEKRDMFNSGKITAFAMRNFGEDAVYKDLMEIYRKAMD